MLACSLPPCYSGFPSSQARTLLLPLPLQLLGISPNALLQAPVVNFAQQRMIAQILLNRQEAEVKRLEHCVHDSVLYLMELI